MLVECAEGLELLIVTRAGVRIVGVLLFLILVEGVFLVGTGPDLVAFPGEFFRGVLVAALLEKTQKGQILRKTTKALLNLLLRQGLVLVHRCGDVALGTRKLALCLQDVPQTLLAEGVPTGDQDARNVHFLAELVTA